MKENPSSLHHWLNSTLTFDTICKEANRETTRFNERVEEKGSRGICYCDYDIGILVHGRCCFICLAADSPRIQRNPLRNSDTKHVPHI